ACGAGLTGSGVDRGRNVPDGRGGRHRSAGRPARVGDRERHGVDRVIRIAVARLDSGPVAPVAKAPGICECVTVRVRRAAAIEGDDRALCADVRPESGCAWWTV